MSVKKAADKWPRAAGAEAFGPLEVAVSVNQKCCHEQGESQPRKGRRKRERDAGGEKRS